MKAKTYSDPQRRLHPKGSSTVVLDDGRRVPCYSGWHVRERDPATGKRKWIYAGETLEGARLFRGKLVARDLRGENDIQLMRFSQAFEEWLGLKSCRKVTLDAYRWDLEGVYKPAFGERLVSEITMADVENFINDLRKKEGLASRTVSKHLICLRSFFRWARRRKLLGENPAEDVKAGKVKKTRENFALKPEEAEALLRSAREPSVLTIEDARRGKWRQAFPPPPYLYTALVIGFFTGLRRKNIFGLRWKHVDFSRNGIFLHGSEMKSGDSLEIPLHPRLRDHIQGLLRGKDKLDPEGFVVGAKVDVSRDALLSACKRAKIPGIGWHTIRHSVATWLSSQCSFACLQAILGHRPGTVTAGYVHPPWDELQRAVDSLPDLLAPAVATEEARPAAVAKL